MECHDEKLDRLAAIGLVRTLHVADKALERLRFDPQPRQQQESHVDLGPRLRIEPANVGGHCLHVGLAEQQHLAVQAPALAAAAGIRADRQRLDEFVQVAIVATQRFAHLRLVVQRSRWGPILRLWRRHLLNIARLTAGTAPDKYRELF